MEQELEVFYSSAEPDDVVDLDFSDLGIHTTDVNVEEANTSTKPLTAKQRMAEEEYQILKAKSIGKDYTSIEALHILEIAGVDNLNRRIVMLHAARIHPKVIDLDLLMLYFIHMLDDLVNDNYALIFMATNTTTENRPPIDWLTTAYTMFNRKYKKNLKAFYLVHPSRTFKITIALLKPFVSSKFWRKLVTIKELNEIYKNIPRGQITFPNYALRYNSKYHMPPPVFGSLLKDVLKSERKPNGVPRVVEDAISYLQDHIRVEGLFRMSGESSHIKKITKAYNLGEHVDLSLCTNPHTVASLLKQFLRELRDPLFPFEYYDITIQYHRLFAKEYEELWVQKTAAVLQGFPAEHIRIMRLLFPFLSQIAEHSEENKMTPSNIAIVFGPNLLRSEGPPSDMNELVEANTIVERFLVYHEALIPS